MTDATFDLIDFTPPVKANPHLERIDQVIAAGEGKAGAVTVPADEVAKNRILINKGANLRGKTARIRAIQDADNGEKTIIFTVGPKHNRGPRKRLESATIEAEVTDSE